MIEEYFSTLEDWKLLPAYKLETRIDSMVGFAIPRIFERLYNKKVEVLIPEFPIRLGSVRTELEQKSYANRSYKVDFYLRTKVMTNIFVEFKSDSGSKRESQDNYLLLSRKIGMRGILEGILKINQATTYKQKYSHLLGKLRTAELLNESNDILIPNEPIEIMYIQPRALPKDGDVSVLGFLDLAKAIRDCYPANDLMNRLSISLERWAVD